MPTSSDRPTKIGKYEILSTIGCGGMGVVYKARDPKIDRIVAIKTILIGDDAGAGEDNLVDRLAMEARSASEAVFEGIEVHFSESRFVAEVTCGVNLLTFFDAM